MYNRSTHDDNKQKDLGLGKSILKKRTSEQEGFQLSNMNDAKKSIHEASIRIAKAPLVEDENRFSGLQDVDKVGKESTTKQEIRCSRNGLVQSLKYSLLKPFSKIDSNEDESYHSTDMYSSLFKPRQEDSFDVIRSNTHSTVKEGVHFLPLYHWFNSCLLERCSIDDRMGFFFIDQSCI